MKKKNNKTNVKKVVAIGAGVAALVAASYYFLGPKGKQHQKSTKDWMSKMKKEVITKMKSMKDVSESTYANLVDTIAAGYAAVGGKQQVEKLAKELKGYWKSISKGGVNVSTSKAKKTAKTVAKKVVKNVAKKVAKKVTKKAQKK